MKLLSLSLAAGLALFVLAPAAHAIPINLGQTAGNPAGPSDELSRLNTQITTYDSTHSPALAAATLTGSPGQVAGSGTSIVLNVTGWGYVLLKWADLDQFYYIGADTGNETFNSTSFNSHGQPQALSHYEFFAAANSSVPDGGSTLALLGAGMSGLGIVMRRRKK